MKKRTTKRQSGLRFEIMNAFVDESMRTLKPAETVVWLTLFRDVRPPDWVASSGVDGIARRAGLSRDTVLRALKVLKSAGLVKVDRQGGINRGVSRYRVLPFPIDDPPDR